MEAVRCRTTLNTAAFGKRGTVVNLDPAAAARWAASGTVVPIDPLPDDIEADEATSDDADVPFVALAGFGGLGTDGVVYGD